MTDRIFAYTVTLKREFREDDAKWIRDAIRMIRGVAKVVPLVSSPEIYYAQQTARRELEEKLWAALNTEE